MHEFSYRFLAALSTEEGHSLIQSPLAPDWYPATESAQFRARRRGLIVTGGAERVTPLWDAKQGAPYVRAVRVDVAGIGDEGEGSLVPLTYFRGDVQSISADLVTQGALKEGDTFHYRIIAFPSEQDGAKGAESESGRWVVEEVPDSCISGVKSLSALLVTAQAPAEPTEEDYPVFIPASVLAQAEALKVEAAENETGGILIGHLWQDNASPELFAEVTALVPAQHTVALSTKLTFTAETWDAARAAIRLRNRGEQFIGWHHTHPSRFWCKCSAESQKQCPLGKQFFSADDRSVHRTVFGRAFHVALVTGDKPCEEGGWEMENALYGWRSGMVAARGFHILDGG